MEHILLCGRRRSGRSSLIRKLLEGVTVPIFGYETLTLRTRPDGCHEIYLYPYGTQQPAPREENHLADCNTRERVVRRELFDSLGVRCLQARENGILVMDEIGFMESGAEAFCRAILEQLDGDLPILAAVRTGMETDFLRRVTAHPRARVLEMSPGRFEEYYTQLRPLVLDWERAIKEKDGVC